MNTMTDLGAIRAGEPIHEKMRIGGERAGGSRVIEVRNPYTGAVVGTVPKGTVEDIRRAFAINLAHIDEARPYRYERHRGGLRVYWRSIRVVAA